MSITVYYVADKTYNITDMVKGVTWSGDINTFPRTLDVEIKNVNNLSKGRLLNFTAGKMLVFHIDGKEKFRGYIFKMSIDDQGNQKLIAYDQLIYLTKNTDTMIIKNQSASDVVSSLLKKFNLRIGKINSTGYKIKKLVCQSKALSDIISDSFDETRKGNGGRYILRSELGSVYLYPRKSAAKVTLNVTDIVSGSYEVSIEDLRTQVKVEKGQIDSTEKDSKYSSVVVKDSAAISKYGIMQEVESADDKDSASTMKNKANTLLRQLNKPSETFEMEFIGHPDCITGNAIEVHNPLIGFNGLYYITSDSHSFDNGTHKMSLQLSKNIGDEDSPGPGWKKSPTTGQWVLDDDSFTSNDLLDPNRHKSGYVQAEDGSWVKKSFYK